MPAARLAAAMAIAASAGVAACSPGPRDGVASAAEEITTHRNPVLDVDCPDPGVLRDEDEQGAVYYMVCTTNGPHDVFRIHRSRDLVTWETTDRFVFPGPHPEDDPARRHPWAFDNFWAPEIHRMPDGVPAAGRYVVYYTARERVHQRLCIGTATAPTAMGPYVKSAEPLVCHDDFGVIDAHYFRDDDGHAYLYWKDDGNDPAPDIQQALGGRTTLHVQRLTDDGLHLAGASGEPSGLDSVPLLDHSLDWEGDLVEAPWVVKRDGAYYLFYSAFSYCDARYAVGVARAPTPLGPFVKHPTEDPILSSGSGFDGPGHGSVVRGPTGDAVYFVYHAWNAGETCAQPNTARRVLVDRVHWETPHEGELAWPGINDGHPGGGVP